MDKLKCLIKIKRVELEFSLKLQDILSEICEIYRIYDIERVIKQM